MTKVANRFLKSHRLLSKADFFNLKQGSELIVCGVLVVYAKTNELQRSRLGLAISKKFGSAVKRNRAKRKLREIYRTSEFKQKNQDFLVTLNLKKIKKEKLDHSVVFQRIEESLNEVFYKLNSKS